MSSKGKHDKHIGFGIDIGGSGIKGAPVDLRKGELADDRLRIPTPQPATPDAVAEVVTKVLDHFDWDREFGCTLPAVVQHGVVRTAANIDRSWIGTDAHELMKKAIDGYDAEKRAADSAREREDLEWDDWAERLTRYYGVVEALLWPDLIVIGGGVSKKSSKWMSKVDIHTKMVPAELLNEAGIVGAALLASEK